MKLAKIAIASALVLAVVACSNDSVVVSQNMKNDAENFKIMRSVKFINGITDKELLELTGFCNVDNDGVRLEALCKTDTGEYVKHFLGLSDNVFYTVEQLEASEASAAHYKFVLKPSTIVPSFEVR